MSFRGAPSRSSDKSTPRTQIPRVGSSTSSSNDLSRNNGARKPVFRRKSHSDPTNSSSFRKVSHTVNANRKVQSADQIPASSLTNMSKLKPNGEKQEKPIEKAKEPSTSNIGMDDLTTEKIDFLSNLKLESKKKISKSNSMRSSTSSFQVRVNENGGPRLVRGIKKETNLVLIQNRVKTPDTPVFNSLSPSPKTPQKKGTILKKLRKALTVKYSHKSKQSSTPTVQSPENSDLKTDKHTEAEQSVEATDEQNHNEQRNTKESKSTDELNITKEKPPIETDTEKEPDIKLQSDDQSLRTIQSFNLYPETILTGSSDLAMNHVLSDESIERILTNADGVAMLKGTENDPFWFKNLQYTVDEQKKRFSSSSLKDELQNQEILEKPNLKSPEEEPPKEPIENNENPVDVNTINVVDIDKPVPMETKEKVANTIDAIDATIDDIITTTDKIFDKFSSEVQTKISEIIKVNLDKAVDNLTNDILGLLENLQQPINQSNIQQHSAANDNDDDDEKKQDSINNKTQDMDGDNLN